MYDFGGDKPRADSCENIQIKCIYDENPSESSQIPKWFELKSETVLFQITKDPFLIKEINSIRAFQERQVHKKNLLGFFIKFLIKIVNVKTTNHAEKGKLPTQVQIDLKYFQYTKTAKKMINAEITFSDFLSPPESNSKKNMEYSIIFNFHPMTHTELIVYFALSWDIYLILYVGICTLAFIMVLILHIYHVIFFRLNTLKK